MSNKMTETQKEIKFRTLTIDMGSDTKFTQEIYVGSGTLVGGNAVVLKGFSLSFGKDVDYEVSSTNTEIQNLNWTEKEGSVTCFFDGTCSLKSDDHQASQKFVTPLAFAEINVPVND